ncbi:hypothetical protein V6M85_07675 [Sulfolobus tengchongensis]|uniref:Uncharacterized protein n=1 Tax=Sulfolobus tengchongensis TaxID=207809 RepID=A0AAX4KYA5_9CREN
MEEVLKQVEAEKPFYGRNFIRIYLDRFEVEKSKEFLIRGFKEEGIEISKDVVEKAVKYFDGIPGWLAYFGRSYTYSLKHGLNPDIKEIVKEASKQVTSDFQRFLKTSNSPYRYAGIVLSLSELRKARLKEITSYLSTLLKENVSEGRVKELIDTLINYGFVIKVKLGIYSLPNDMPTKLGLRVSAKKWLRQ